MLTKSHATQPFYVAFRVRYSPATPARTPKLERSLRVRILL